MHRGVDFVELLEQPKARAAMDMRDVKRNNGNLFVSIVYQLADDGRLAEVIEPFVGTVSGSTRMIVIIIIAAQLVLRQNLVNTFTTLTTKIFVVGLMNMRLTFVAAMVTSCCL